MIFARLLFSHYCLLLFNLEGGVSMCVRMKSTDGEVRKATNVRHLVHRKRITYAEIFRKGLSHKTYNILQITSKAA